METREHLGLKELAAAWLLSMGCRAVAHEVHCPVARFRVDAAGWMPDGPATVVVECKASRADFMRDDLRVDDLLAERERLLGRKAEIERELIPVHEPHLRRDGAALFDDDDGWDFAHSRLLPYRRVLRQLAKVEERMHGQTKFNLIARWRLADRLWVLAVAGTVRPREVPHGWGLAECAPALLRRGIGHALAMGTLPVRVVVPAPEHRSPDARKDRLLRNIAMALTKAQYRGIKGDSPGAGPADGSSPSAATDIGPDPAGHSS